MDGIVLVNKPKDMTSHDVVNIVRKAFNTKKVGHSGTLDPDATGLLVLGVNRGTKILRYLNNDDKIYQATVCIGTSTTTLDATGSIVATKPVQKLINASGVIASFKGSYTQIPPMYSAIKHNGKRLYEYARKGIEITNRKSRTIELYEIHATSDVTYKDNCAYIDYMVHGSKGLYVRTLSYDIGHKLGYPAHNAALHRVKAGTFYVQDAFTIKEIQDGQSRLIGMADALENMNTLQIDDRLLHHVKHGMAISLTEFTSLKTTKIVDQDNTLLAIYEKHPTQEKMKALNVFIKD